MAIALGKRSMYYCWFCLGVVQELRIPCKNFKGCPSLFQRSAVVIKSVVDGCGLFQCNKSSG